MVIVTITVYAKPPRLNVERLFDGRYNNNKNVTISIYKTNGNYYRGITIKNNPKIIHAIAEAIEKDSAQKTIPTIKERMNDIPHFR